MIYEQGEIVIVPFPFTNLSGIKQRPVLILSKKEYNTAAEDVITCGITSNLKNDAHSIRIDNTNLLEGKVLAPSRIKVDKLFTLHQSIIIKRMGRLNQDTIREVKDRLFKLM